MLVHCQGVRHWFKSAGGSQCPGLSYDRFYCALELLLKIGDFDVCYCALELLLEFGNFDICYCAFEYH